MWCKILLCLKIATPLLKNWKALYQVKKRRTGGKDIKLTSRLLWDAVSLNFTCFISNFSSQRCMRITIGLIGFFPSLTILYKLHNT